MPMESIDLRQFVDSQDVGRDTSDTRTRVAVRTVEATMEYPDLLSPSQLLTIAVENFIFY